MSRWRRGEPVASHAQAYHRWPLEPGPAERTSQRRLCFSTVFTASAQVSLVPAARVRVKSGRHPQHVRLAPGFEVPAQLGAVAVHLVSAVEVRPDPAGGGVLADVDGQLSLGAEHQVQRQSHDQGLHRVLEVLTRNPLPGADQRVPGLLPHVRQMNRVDAVGYLARAAQVLPLDPGGGLAGLFLPGLVDRPDHQAAAAFPAPRRLLKPGHREPSHHAHRGEGVPAGVVQQPLGLIRRLVPGVPGDAPPVALRQLAHHRGGVLARLQPRPGPGETRPQQRQQLRPFPQRQPGAYPDGSSRLCSCTSHTGMITRRLRSRQPIP